MGVCPGQIVYSIAGRDAGRKFIIVSIMDKTRVTVSDGDLRRIKNAKLKNLKHLKLTDRIISPLGEKIKNKERLTNAEIRKALSNEGNIETD